MRFRIILASLVVCTATALSANPPDFLLDPVDTSRCFTDSSQGDFSSDVPAVNCDITSTPGSVKLSQPSASIDQQNTTVTASVQTFGLNAITWAGQTFTAGVSGTITKVDLLLGCSGAACTTPPNVLVSIRAVDSGTGAPTGADLQPAAAIPGVSSSTPAYYTATFGTPVAVTAGTKYAIVMRSSASLLTAAFTYPCSCTSPDSNPYAGGARVSSGSSGSTWAVDANSGGRDMGFKVYTFSGYASTGTFTSNRKDTETGIGGTVTWGTISWNATVPAGTTLQFQVAASSFAAGPFNFVGPDGTANTYFNNGASLAQFNGKRFLRYQAHMTSTGAATPQIDDVTICFTTTPQPLVDFDGDDTGDVFTYNNASGDWKRAIAQGDGTFVEANGMWDPNWIITPAKFNQDNLTDMFLYNATSGQWFRMLNNGTNGFTTQATGTWWNGWQRHVMDLNGDGLSDVFLYDPTTGVWFKSVLTANADFSYSQGGWNPNWEITPMILNDDAIGDMFLIDRTTGRWFWVLGQEGGGFLYPVTDVWFQGWNFHPGDFNGDGMGDLLLHHTATGNYFVAMNNGLATGFTYTSGGWSLGWTPYVGDLDADGDQDLFLHSQTTGQWFEMISNGAGAFANGGSQTWSLGWNIYPTDLNGDGRTDFLLYHPNTGVWYQARNLTLGTFTYTSGNWNPGLTILVRSPFM